MFFLCQPSPIAILTANGSCTSNHVEDFRLRNVDIGDMKAVPLIYDVYSICASHMLNHIGDLQYAALVFISLLTFLLPYFSRTHDVVYLKSDFQNSINQHHNLKNEKYIHIKTNININRHFMRCELSKLVFNVNVSLL